MKPFNLIRYFAAASLGVVVILALATAYTFSRNLEKSLTEEAGLYAQDIGSLLNRVVFKDFVIPRQREGISLDLEDPAQLRALDAIVAERIEGMRVLTVILFDRSGTIIYSNKPDYIGYRSIDNPGLASALGGTPASLLKRAELERDPLSPGHDLLETYTPFYEYDPEAGRTGEPIGVIEIYQDARPITGKIAQGHRRILLATAGLMLVLFLALFAIVRRGHLRITELTRELADTNEDLEQRVRVRTLEIETARQRLRALFDGIADGISVIDGAFRVSETNSGIAHLFGADGDARTCHARYAGRDAPCPGCPARTTLATGRPAAARYRWPAAGGREADVEVTTFPFAAFDGAQAVIEVVRDVSERSDLERQVVQSAHLAAMGELAAAVAHEIRNPIGMIQSAAQLLESGSQLPERERKLLRAIREETGRVGRTVSEFVGFATPPAPSRAATDPGALVERVQTMLKPEAERTHVQLEVSLDPAVPKFSVDAELIYRALTNLVLNAIQVQRDGGRVEICTRCGEPGEVSLHVIDRGPGIPAEDLERIFDPFFSRRPGGTGLGLSVVQRIVTAHGGRISVTSGPGHTEFVLRFPAEPA